MAHLFPDTVLNTSLLSIAQLCKLGCTATFTSTEVHVTHTQHTVFHGSKMPDDSLWSIGYHSTLTLPPAANATHAIPFIRFTHAALGSPAISTLTQAVRRGYLRSYPALTPLCSPRIPQRPLPQPRVILTSNGKINDPPTFRCICVRLNTRCHLLAFAAKVEKQLQATVSVQ